MQVQVFTFSIDRRVSQDLVSLLFLEKGEDTLTNGDFPYKCKCLLQKDAPPHELSHAWARVLSLSHSKINKYFLKERKNRNNCWNYVLIQERRGWKLKKLPFHRGTESIPFLLARMKQSIYPQKQRRGQKWPQTPLPCSY